MLFKIAFYKYHKNFTLFVTKITATYIFKRNISFLKIILFCCLFFVDPCIKNQALPYKAKQEHEKSYYIQRWEVWFGELLNRCMKGRL